MKAVILEIRKGQAAVLGENGIVVRIDNKNYSVGDTVYIKKKRSHRFRTQVMRAGSVAAAAVVAFSIGGMYHYTTIQACSYVTLDINPSFEYVLNWQNKVLSVEALNEDAEEYVSQLQPDVKRKSLSEALEITKGLLTEENILEGTEDYVLVNVSCDSEERKAFLTDEAEDFFGAAKEVTLVVTEATMEERETARDLGISTGKYKEMETIEKQNKGSFEPTPETVRTYRDLPVKDVMSMAGQIPEERRMEEKSPSGNGESPLQQSGREDIPTIPGQDQDMHEGQPGQMQGQPGQIQGRPDGQQTPPALPSNNGAAPDNSSQQPPKEPRLSNTVTTSDLSRLFDEFLRWLGLRSDNQAPSNGQAPTNDQAPSNGRIPTDNQVPSNGQMPGGQPPQGGPGGDSAPTTYAAANTVTADSTGASYTSSSNDENAVLVDGKTVTISGAVVNKTGDLFHSGYFCIGCSPERR